MRLFVFAPVVLAVTIPCAAQVSPVVQAKRAVDPADKMVCHSEPVTGSLSRFKRTCMTRAQWAAQSHDTQEQAERLVDHGLINPCNPGC